MSSCFTKFNQPHHVQDIDQNRDVVYVFLSDVDPEKYNTGVGTFKTDISSKLDNVKDRFGLLSTGTLRK